MILIYFYFFYVLLYLIFDIYEYLLNMYMYKNYILGIENAI
jgi:hypothetical protein